MTRPVWDLFCAVVDNYGDAAFGWRLASQLVAEHGIDVRLWIDRPDVLQALRPELATTSAQTVDPARPQVLAWRAGDDRTAAADWPAPGEVAIDAFGCGLPAGYLAAKAALARRTLWITTEYLSAEPWVLGHHGLASPHPATGLPRWFFFPGFRPGTGGVLREVGYEARRAAGQGARPAAAFWTGMGYAPPAGGALVVSLFGYDGPALASLVDGWATGAVPVVLAVTRCPLAGPLAALLGVAGRAGDGARRGALEARFLPFLAQDDYDRLVWNADVNFVRGEDSLCRALWARRPCVWQPYRQAAAAHDVKLAAFLDWYAEEGGAGRALRALATAWNGGAGPEARTAWAGVVRDRAALTARAGERAEALTGAGEFTAQLVDFCRKRLN